ncbi:MAG: hypothetical protein WAK17_09815 [Candidatus Nitrosopolaris sp.]|jgi:hypothetical protein
MGETTTLALNAPNKASLRTTIPMFIVKQWGLKSGDQLDWSFSLLNNEMIVVVRKAGKVNTKTTTVADLRKETTKQRSVKAGNRF